MIQLKNIERSYKTPAGQTWVLRRINLEIREGEFITIMGPSGAGKSSLLNVLALLDDQWAGEYWFREQAVHDMKRKARAELAKKNIGMVFQSYHLLDDLTVRENIDLPLSYKDVPSRQRQGMVADTLDRFQIVAKKDLFPSQLSRRAATACGSCPSCDPQTGALARRRTNGEFALLAGARNYGAVSRTQSAGNYDCSSNTLRCECRVWFPDDSTA